MLETGKQVYLRRRRTKRTAKASWLFLKWCAGTAVANWMWYPTADGQGII